MVRLSDSEEFVLADIPGLIEGAHEGAGLGDRFLGHVERCAVLLHLVDGAAGNVVEAWRTVRDELAAYGGGLADKPEIVALNKTDAMTPQQIGTRRRALERATGGPVLMLSAATHGNVPERCAAGAATRVQRAQWTWRTRGPRGAAVTPRRGVPSLHSRRAAGGGQDRQRAAGGCRSGRLRAGWLDRVAADIAGCGRGARGDRRLVRRHRAGAPALGLTRRALRLEEKQAAAAVGQIALAQAWSERCRRRWPDRGAAAADARRHRGPAALPQRAGDAATLLGLGCVPVINENDTVATAEIRYGDNDRLAARVAEMVERRPAGAAVRHRRAVHRRPAPDPRRRTSRWCRR